MNNSLQDVLSSMQIVCTELTKVINLNIIVNFVGIILTSALALYVGWFGIRTLIDSIKNALNGNLSILSSIESRKARRWYKKEGYKYYNSYDDYVESYNKDIENDIYIH